MTCSTEQLRKDNALGEYAPSEEEEAIKIVQAPSSPVPPTVDRHGRTSATSDWE